MNGVVVACVGLVACGSASRSTAPPVAEPVVQPSGGDERARRNELAARHHKLEEVQQEALAATCTEKEPRKKHERCLPSCYATEPADPRAGKQVAGALEIVHLVCEKRAGDGSGPFVIADEIEGAKLAVRTVRGGFPRAHAKGTWQAKVATSIAAAKRVKRGEVVIVSGTWRNVDHPITKEPLRCVKASHYATALRRPLDGCGSDGSLACEALGNAVARGINVVHYRLEEARRLQQAGKQNECQQAALEAVAVARGMPRWRQYMQLNVAKWTTYAGYRTRFDGILDEDTVFTTAIRLGKDAEVTYAACGGAANAPTTVEQEQSFHVCW